MWGSHKYEACPNKQNPVCCRCGGKHSAAYAGCKTIKNEKQIQFLHAEKQISYAEATRIVKDQQDRLYDVGPPQRSNLRSAGTSVSDHTSGHIGAYTAEKRVDLIQSSPTYVAELTNQPHVTVSTRDVGTNTDKVETSQTQTDTVWFSSAGFINLLVEIFRNVFSLKSRSADAVTGVIAEAMNKICNSGLSGSDIMGFSGFENGETK